MRPARICVTRKRLWIWTAGLWLLCAPAHPQGKCPAECSTQMLPASAGKPFTVVPMDMPDVECQVMEWAKGSGGSAVGTLTLLCPPPQVFSPLRVLIKLSQLRHQEKPPAEVSDTLLIVPGEKTRLRTRKESAFVYLNSLDTDGKSHKTWIPFTAVEDVALLSQYPKQRR